MTDSGTREKTALAGGWREAMRRLYAALDDELSALGAHCSGCGRCCRFDEADHVLYASTLERKYLAALAADAVIADSDADPELLARGLRCPFQAGGRCLAREGRVLGCRLYHCAWPDGVDEEALYRRWHDRLKRLHDELGEEWAYGPLLPLG